uniref:GTD-binding domain-containing protein n=1 Tax=Oryza glumipatula TaxID=40148 RepID=A0A0D9ZB52_9ORYZ
MDEDHDCDPDQPPAGAAAGASPCSCCSTPCAVATWRRSVKRKLGEEKGDGEGEGEGAVVLARVEAEEEAAALREAVAAAQETAAALRSEVEEERLAAASAASEAMAMMLRLQREKAEVQMELRQFRRFADEKMALDAAEIDHLRAALARRARHLARLRSTLREYRHTCLRLGIPLAEGDQADELALDDGFVLEGEDGDGAGYYPELRCYDGEYYYEDGQEGGEEEDDPIVVDLERRIYLLEHDHKDHGVEPCLEEEEGAPLYADEPLPDSSEQELNDVYADEVLPEGTVQERNQCSDDELPESPAARNGSEEEGSDSDGGHSGSGSDRVYTIDKVHQGATAPAARVLENYQDGEVEPDIKKLYMRLEALEADRESMRQALVAMHSEKAQLVLLREIAQQLAKDATPANTGGFGVVPTVHHFPGKQDGFRDQRFRENRKMAIAKRLSMVALCKWIVALFRSQKRNPSQSRYTFGLSGNNVGLLVLLDKYPRIQKTLTRRK